MQIKCLNDLQEKAKQLDATDDLAHKLHEFELPKQQIYLDGNSLGPLTKAAKARAKEVVEQQWGADLIESWNKHKWIGLPKTIGNKIANLIGAEENTVVCADSISVNLFKVLSAALLIQEQGLKQETQQTPPIQNKRTIILSQADNFPSDIYMAQGLSNLLGENRCKLHTVSSKDIEHELQENGDKIAVVMLTHVNFKNGDISDMQAITQLAHQKGALIIWDLAHSAGVLPLELQHCEVDFAVGCTYKYLNGGPGAPAFVYVAKKLQKAIQQPLSGWMGHKQAFAFLHDYEAADGPEQMLSGTPPILSMSILDASLGAFEGINIHQIRHKSIALNGFFQECVEHLMIDDLFELACHPSANLRGSQISYTHPYAYAICQALIAHNVVPDFRAPNILRLGFSPLFLTYEQVFNAARILADLVNKQEYKNSMYQQMKEVT
ncbi:kynureninase [Glaciecola petra]|uniref:Kynureninase n=1 Tax=Glaciecola petra TaxID=3075602 RepID=A0ABU2ZLQ8_9ALTE|nr:kynureninase [Aestuariibacter sp. P117]MDT0593564.1 kynureninase [Aestuariibacter sp. P117]